VFNVINPPSAGKYFLFGGFVRLNINGKKEMLI